MGLFDLNYEDTSGSPTWGDWGRSVAMGANDAGSGLAAAGRWIAEQRGDVLTAEHFQVKQQVNKLGNEDIESEMSPAGKRLLASSVSSSDFWDQPFSAGMLKGLRMTPTFAAALIPGALLPGIGGVAGMAIAGGTIQGAQYLDEVYKNVDATPDDKLQEASSYYAGLRTRLDEKEARKQYTAQLRENDLLVNFAIGAVGNSLGAAGQIGRGLKGAAGAVGTEGMGVVGRTAAGVAEGAGSGMVQTGVQNLTTQQALVRGGLKNKINTDELADAVLEGGLFGAVGGVAGSAAHEVFKERTTKAKPTVDQTSNTLKGTGTGTPIKPVVDVTSTGNPDSASTGSEQNYPKTNETKPKSKAATPDPTGIDPDIALAREQAKQPPQGKTPTAESEVMPSVSDDTNVNGPKQLPETRPPAEEVTSQITQPGAASPKPRPSIEEATAAYNAALEAYNRARFEPADAGQPKLDERGMPEKITFSGRQELAQKVADSRAAMNEAKTRPAEPAPKTESGAPVPGTNPFKVAYDKAVDIVRSDGKASTSYIQRKLGIGYGNAAKIMERMEANGVVSPASKTGKRTVLPLAEPAKPVTSEGNAPTPAAPKVTPKVAEVVAKAKGPRVLEDLTPENRAAREDYHAQEMAQREQVKTENKRAEEAGIEGPKRSHKGAEHQAKKEAQAKAAQEIMDRHTPIEKESDEQVLARARSMVEEAKQHGVKPPDLLRGEDHAASTVVLREATDLVEKSGGKAWKANKQLRTEATTRFRVNEHAARTGDVAEVLSRRRAEAEALMRKDQGDVEKKADPVSGKRAAVVDSETNVGDSGLRGVSDGTEKTEKGETRAKAASPGRKVEVTPELAAKYGTPKPAPKVTPKVAEVVAKAKGEKPKPRVLEDLTAKAEPKEVTSEGNVPKAEPSEAQKEAGNYPKKHIKVHGLDISVENERGSTRSGKDANGKEWSTTMPDDYGYIKRTAGADGDQVDVYVGKNHDSDHVLVIDQKDHATGKFDEHKVMLGYDDAGAALEAYEKAFSDGKGLDRIGAMHPMSVEEFKQWLKKGDTTKPVDHPTLGVDAIRTDARQSNLERIKQVLAERRAEDTQAASRGKIEFVTHGQGEFVNARAIGRAKLGNLLEEIKDFIPAINIPHKATRQFFEQIRSKLLEKISDMDVYLVTDAEMRDMSPGNAAFYSPVYDHIVVSKSMADNRKIMGQYLIHEAIHGVTTRAMLSGVEHVKYVREVMDTTARLRPDIAQDYAFTNEREFVAEALSNHRLQAALRSIVLSPKDAIRLGVYGWRDRVATMWDAIVNTARKAMGLNRGSVSALETMISLTDDIAHQPLSERFQQVIDKNRSIPPKELARSKLAPDAAPIDAIKNSIREAKDALMDVGEQAQKGKPWALAAYMTNQLAQKSRDFFRTDYAPGGKTSVDVIHETQERTRTTAHRLMDESAPMVAKLDELEKKYQQVTLSGNKTQWGEFADFVHDATNAQVHPDVDLTHAKNKHLHFSKTEHLDQVRPRARHADLAARYELLPDDLKKAYHEATDYFSKTQNDMSLGIIENRILKALGHDDPGLAKRIFDGTTTDADKDTLGHGDRAKGERDLKLIEDAKELSKIKGPYVPLMRRGDYVVRAEYDVPVPSGARKIKDNVVEFNSRKEAVDYARRPDLDADLESVWVDKNTGETTFSDGTKVTSKDTDAEQRFRATVRHEHVEFTKTEREARLKSEQLRADPGVSNVKGVVTRRYEPHGRDAGMTGSHMATLLKSLQGRKSWADMSKAERETISSALTEASIRWMGSTRIQSRRLPRNYVAGYSTDFVRNAYDYSVSSSQHLAKLEHAPVLEKAMKDMREEADSDKYDKTSSLGRSIIAKEVEKRADQPVFEEAKGLHAWMKRFLTGSFLDKLAGPSYSVMNAAQTPMLTYPVLAGRHGPGKSFTQLRQAMSDVGGLGVIKQGAKNTVSKLKPGAEVPGFMDDIIARAAKDAGERGMFKHLIEVGTISPDSGMEVTPLIAQREGGVGGGIDKVLGYLEGIAREMPRAIEATARAGSALAAYRLEKAKGADHDTAVRYAQDVVNNTHFNYSHTNKAPWMNHPLSKFTLQFKVFAQGAYHLLGMNIGRALTGATRAERMEAIKTLTGLAATHVAMAGALGLPLEPFKYLLLGLNTVGITNTNWNEVEDKARKISASLLGKTGGEVAMKGLPRLLGVDLSSRAGLDSLTSFGSPRSQKETDVKSWLFDTLSGAPIALGGDWVKGSNALMAGEFEKAAELLVPIKVFSDSLRAYRQATEGKKSQSGRESMTPYTPYEAATRALGFTPRREAEAGAQAASFNAAKTRAGTERQNLVNKWVNAVPGEKTEAFAAVTRWNAGRRPEERIKMTDLTSAAQKRVAELKDGTMVNGIRTTKRDKYLLDNSPYNALP